MAKQEQTERSYPDRKLTELTEDTNACINCVFFDKFKDQKKQDNFLGACKANPPVPAPDWNESKLGIWPLVLGTFWCGLFLNKKEKEK